MTRGPGRPPADRERILAAYRAGRPVAWICSRLGVSRAAVYQILARAGVERDRRPGGPRAPRASAGRGDAMGGELQGEWLAFWGACFPSGDTAAAEGQREEMRRAFFAGAWVALRAVAPPGDPARWGALRGEAERALESMIRPPAG